MSSSLCPSFLPRCLVAYGVFVCSSVCEFEWRVGISVANKAWLFGFPIGYGRPKGGAEERALWEWAQGHLGLLGEPDPALPLIGIDATSRLPCATSVQSYRFYRHVVNNLLG